MRYRLSTLMIVLALGPPALALAWLHREPVAMLAGILMFTTTLAILATVGCGILCCLVDGPITFLERLFGKR